ncbi:hypothetical protein AB205_0099910, partial [Aquarana catesbeiana]
MFSTTLSGRQAGSMSGRPPRKGKRSQAIKRGQAFSVSTANSAGHGHGASSAHGHGAHLSFFSTAGHVKPQHAEELVEWIIKPSSSSVTQAKTSLAANAAAKVAYSIVSMASVSPSLAPPSCPEESPKLFDHSVGYMLQEDVQRFEGSDDGTQVEDEGSTVSPERGGAKKDKKLAVMFPQLQHTARFAPVARREGMMRSLTLRECLIEERRRRHSSNEAGCPLGASLRTANRLHHTAELRICRALLTPCIFSKVLWCGPFLRRAADRTIAVCNICLKRINHVQNSCRLGTTCLTRHMSSSHAVHWQQYLKDPHQRTRRTSPCSSSAGISNPTIPS